MRPLIPNTAAEIVAAWDAGELVHTIELGGLGPGYEQTIHCLVVELLRAPADFEAVIDRLNPLHRFSGAQVGAAKSFAKVLLDKGMIHARRLVPQDRHILVSKRWPAAEELEALLREWRRTPFFEDPGEWKAWVKDFGARVDVALSKPR